MYFAHPIDIFCLTNFEKNTNLSGTVSLWYVLVLILIRAILEQSINNKIANKTEVGMSTTDMYLH